MSSVSRWIPNTRQRWQLASLWPMLFIFIAALYLAPDTKTMRNTYYLVVLLPALVLLRREDLRLLWQSSVLRAASLFLGYLWLSCLWSTPSEVGQVAKVGAQLVYLLVFLLVATRCLESDIRRKQFMTLLLVVATIGAFLSLWKFWEIWQARGVDHWLWIRRMTFWGSADHSIIGASLYAPATICAFLGLIDSKDWRRLIWMLAGLLLLILVVRSYSRGPLLSVTGTLLVGIMLNRERKTALLCGLVIVVGLAWLGYQDFGAMLARGTSIRPQIWLSVWQDTLHVPLLGHGLLSDESVNLIGAGGRQVLVDHPHSIFMATLFYSGFFGLLLLFRLLVSTLGAGVSAFRDGQQGVLLLLILAVALCVTDNNKLLLSPSPIWLFFWLPVAFAATVQRSTLK